MAIDEMRLLMAAAEKPQPEKADVGRDVTTVLVMVALTLGCIIAFVVLLAGALAIALSPRIGNPALATLIAAIAFAIVAVGLVITVRGQVRRTGTDVARRTGAGMLFGASEGGPQIYDVINAAGLSHPRTIWDFAMLVGVGFISGLNKGKDRD